MPIKRTFQECIRLNERLKCKVPGCHQHRSRIACYCQRHQAKYYRYGHPEAEPLRPKEYQEEREEIAAMVEANLGHKGIKIALELIDGLVVKDGSLSYPAGSAKWFLLKLHIEGLTPQDILTECGAICLYEARNPKRIKTKKHLIYTLGHRVARLKPFSGGISAIAVRSIGTTIYDQLGVLFVSMVNSIQAKERKLEERRKELGKPLNVRD